MPLLFPWLLQLLLFQDPYRIAPANYTLELDNEWVRVSRARFQPGEKLSAHSHPALPTIYIYLTDGGPMRFAHSRNFVVTRPAVKAGAVRLERGIGGAHQTMYLGDTPCEYLRMELKTEPLDPPGQDVRLEPAWTAPFENAQVRITSAAKGLAAYPSVSISLQDRAFQWSEKDAPPADIRVELKSKPPLRP